MVLLVQGDSEHRLRIRNCLMDIGIECDCVSHSATGLQQLQKRAYDLVILDVHLTDGCGLDLCRQIRQRSETQAVMFVATRCSETDRILGLELGADDFINEPYCVRELQARVKAQLRRINRSLAKSRTLTPKVLQWGAFLLDTQQHYFELCGQEVELTAKEFTLLSYLAHHPNQVFSRNQLLEAVWGYAHSGYEHNVNSHINRLRTKLAHPSLGASPIQTVWGVGYKFNPAVLRQAHIQLARA